jgi:hypothetical protein
MRSLSLASVGQTVKNTTKFIEMDWTKNLPKIIIYKHGRSTDDIMQTDNFFEKLIKTPRELDPNQFCNFLKKELEKINTLCYSEDILRCKIAQYLFQFIESEKCMLIGIDQKIGEIILGKKLEFRCDISFIFRNYLVIIEVKFKADRVAQEIDAYECINYRAYPQRTLNFLKDNHYEVFKNIDFIFNIGIGYSTHQDLRTGIIFSIQKAKEFDLEICRTKKFIDEMKLRAKGFNFLKKKRLLKDNINHTVKKDEEETL